MSHFVLFDALLTLSCAYALWQGPNDNRLVAIICLLATILSHLLEGPATSRFSALEAWVFVVDAAALAGFTLVALRSERFWPLWVAGLQLTTIWAHFFKTLESGLVAQVYAAAERFWSYPILLILILGTWRRTRQEEPDGLRS